MRAAISLLLIALAACTTPTAPAVARPGLDPVVDPFLDTLQVRTFGYFRDLPNRENGLVPDRWPTPSFSSIAAVGFGLTAYVVAVERGWLARADARDRTLTTLRFLYRAPQGLEPAGVIGYKGFFYHFLDMRTGHRFQQVELSTIDTALLLAGALTSQSFFTGADPAEASIRAYADSLYARVDWRWAQARAPAVALGWHPETGFIAYDWKGYNEAMILYVLALGSPTFAIEPAAWDVWTSTYEWGEYYGQQHVGFAPLFGHQYSHIWIDFRGIRDAYMRGRGIDYFENSRRALHAQHAYAIANPDGWRDYGADIWGLTASDGPQDLTREFGGRERRFYGYAARGASFTEVRDDGTIAPTALGGSIPFDPALATAGLKAMRARYGDRLFSTYGFLDAFNPTFTWPVPVQQGTVDPALGWVDGDYLGIDQGPIIAMIENYRTGLIWRLMRNNPHIVRGLRRAGFTGGWLEGVP